VRQVDTTLKIFLRKFYKGCVSIWVFLSGVAIKRKRVATVFYCGARRGDIGGPLVKIKRLQAEFPQSNFAYNNVYLISNAPYLSREALLSLKRKNIKITLNQNGVFYPSWYGEGWEIKNQEMAIAYHISDYVFWQSHFCKRAAERFLGHRDGKGEILYNAVDLNHFRPANRRCNKKFTFLLAGKVQHQLSYRLISALESLAFVRKKSLNAHLNVAGWIEDSVQFKRLITDLKLEEHVTILGPFSQKDAPGLFQTSDAFLSNTHMDACPNTVIEALACGLPVVYNSTGGVPELVGLNAGVPVKSHENWNNVSVPSAELFAMSMLELAERRDEMADAARAQAEKHFCILRWFQRHREIFTSN
jgi:glycosyltransferase involved in cell wall biosynthesis